MILDLNAQFEARARLEALLTKRSKIATENFVRCVIDIGVTQGYDLTAGDKCFVHPDDVPASVKLDASHPVIPTRAVAMVRGQMFFVGRDRLDSALNEPAILTPKTGTQ